MTDANIVSELLRAANVIEALSASEVRQLLHRSIVAIRNMRQDVGIPAIGTSKDAIIGLADVAARAETSSGGELRGALLDAADMIRTLRVLIQSGVELTLRETENAPGV
jgi:hypothetical protein